MSSDAKVERFLDVGGGSGAFCIVMARKVSRKSEIIFSWRTLPQRGGRWVGRCMVT